MQQDDNIRVTQLDESFSSVDNIGLKNDNYLSRERKPINERLNKQRRSISDKIMDR